MRAKPILCLAVASTLAACSYDPKVDPAKLACKDDNGCPSGYRCVGASPGQPGVCCSNADPGLCAARPDAGEGDAASSSPPVDAATADVGSDLPMLSVDSPTPATDLPIQDVRPAADLALQDAPPTGDLPLQDTPPATDLPIPDAPPALDLPVQDAPPVVDVAHPDAPSSLKTNGATCLTPAECASTYCQQGICCETTCIGACRSCVLAGSPGVCTNVPDGQDPLDHCSDQGPASCGTDGACNGGGACRMYSLGTECAPGSCAGGTETQPRTCDGAGSCQPATVKQCSPYVCGATACKAACTTIDDCVAPNGCYGGSCSPTSCTNNIQDDLETDKDCGGGQCKACTTGKSCKVHGDCLSVTCIYEVCRDPTCTDRVQNQGEGDVDCGGPCPTKCADGRQCLVWTDCVSGSCKEGTCDVSCAAGNGGCDLNAKCTNTQAARICECKPGYSGDGQSCGDIDECQAANGGCSSHATCTNTIGSRTCACIQGYTGNGTTCACSSASTGTYQGLYTVSSPPTVGGYVFAYLGPTNPDAGVPRARLSITCGGAPVAGQLDSYASGETVIIEIPEDGRRLTILVSGPHATNVWASYSVESL